MPCYGGTCVYLMNNGRNDIANDAMNDQGQQSKDSILLVDDSKLVRFAANKVLGDEFELHLAEDGEQGWQLLIANDNIQLVLSDLQMPILDGFGLLEKIRQSEDERLSQLPVIMVTGADNTAAPKERAMAMGATDFIAKPFDPAHLIARVRAYIGHQRQTRSLMEYVNVDAVTGLINRQGFESRLIKDAAFVTRHRHSLVVMLIQLDNYKKLFEAIGRSGYDKIMRQIAGLFQNAVRKEDTVARAGLAQFLVSLPTAQFDSVNDLARRFARAVEACPLTVDGESWQLSLSIGVFASQAGCAVAANSIMHSAHEALEQSLNQGSSHIAVQSMTAQTDSIQLSLDQLLAALEQGSQLPASINMDQVVETLKPLMALLSDAQRKILLQ